jgi:hypothetical protein
LQTTNNVRYKSHFHKMIHGAIRGIIYGGLIGAILVRRTIPRCLWQEC